jgi:hypothetical protein
MSGEGGSGGVHGQRGPSPHGWIGRALDCDVCFCGRTLASTGAREVGLNASVDTHTRARRGIGTHPSSEVSDKSGVLDQGRRALCLARALPVVRNGERVELKGNVWTILFQI